MTKPPFIPTSGLLNSSDASFKVKGCKSRKPVSYSGDGSNIVSKKYPNQIREPKNSRKFTCYNCGLEFEEKSEFVAHWLEHVRCNVEKSSKKKKKSGPFKCKICKTKFAKKSTLKKHLREDCHLSTEAPNEPPRAHGQSKPMCQLNAELMSRGHGKRALWTGLMSYSAPTTISPSRGSSIIAADVTGALLFLFTLTAKELTSTPHISHLHIGLFGRNTSKCDLCPLAFKLHSDLRKHMRGCHFNERPFKCDECSIAFKNGGTLRKHRAMTHSDLRPFKCSMCDAAFKSRSSRYFYPSLSDTIRFETLQTSLTCHLHPMIVILNAPSFSRRCLLIEVAKIILRKTSPSLKEGFDSVSKKFSNQIRNRERSRNFTCYKCGLEFERKSEFVAHWLEHVRGNVEKTSKKKKKTDPFKCKICKTKFSKKSTLKKHLREDCHLATEAPNEPPKARGQSKLFRCSFCDHVTSYRSHLTQHLAIHSDLRPFKCDVCVSSFKRQLQLKQHKRTCHSNERHFKCNQCPMAFKLSTHLRQHQICIHSDLRPFKCNLCDASFKLSATLRYHQRVHSSLKPYSCDLCDRAYKRNVELNIHKRKKHGIV
ncbi:unnamed protein product [Bemisia tabaci]|uniref:C2H2-type domain-containing protein n=1 Tax=Bemisia tabaci TaxID=7038 RepID=A0A9P0AKA2_BEMTA|nr:unnamed protein product [Bemisia tabaci]